MKIKHLFSLLVLSLSVLPSFSQNFQGSEAERVLKGSQQVHFGGKSSTLEFVRFRENARFPASKFQAWAKKAFQLGENVSLKKLSESKGKLGMRHIRYQLQVNGIPVFGAFCTVHVENDMVVSVNGKIPSSVNPSSAQLNENGALEFAMDHIGATSYKWQIEGEEAHLKWESEDPNATYFPKRELVYRVTPLGRIAPD